MPTLPYCVVTGKQMHPNHAAAKQVVAHLLRRPQSGSSQTRALRWAGKARLDAYHCRLCGAWHIGHRPLAIAKRKGVPA